MTTIDRLFTPHNDCDVAHSGTIFCAHFSSLTALLAVEMRCACQCCGHDELVSDQDQVFLRPRPRSTPV